MLKKRYDGSCGCTGDDGGGCSLNDEMKMDGGGCSPMDEMKMDGRRRRTKKSPKIKRSRRSRRSKKTKAKTKKSKSKKSKTKKFIGTSYQGNNKIIIIKDNKLVKKYVRSLQNKMKKNMPYWMRNYM